MTETTTTGALPEISDATLQRLANAWGVFRDEARAMLATAKDVIEAEDAERRFLADERIAFDDWIETMTGTQLPLDIWLARARIHRDYEARVEADIEERTANTSAEMDRVCAELALAKAEMERAHAKIERLQKPVIISGDCCSVRIDGDIQVDGATTVTRDGPDSVRVEFFPPTAPDGTPLDATDVTSTAAVLGEVAAERIRQFEKWGRQRWPLTPMLHPAAGEPGSNASIRFLNDRRLLATGLRSAKEAKILCEYAFKEGIGTFAHILVEEVAESIDSPTLDEMRAELIQVAAVAVQMVEVIDLNAAEAAKAPTDG